MARKREERSPNKSGSQQQSGGGGGGACGGTNNSNSTASTTTTTATSSSGSGGGSGGGGGGSKIVAPIPVFVSLKQQLAALGLVMKEIPGDGNCLFGALADQVDGSRNTHYKHRHQIVAYMRQNRVHFEPFVEDDVSFHDHLRRLSEVGTFGGNECIVAFARLHNVMVVIHQLNTALWTISGNEESQGGGGCPPPHSEVHISYHNGDHYNSVRKTGDCSHNPANIRLAVVTTNTIYHQPPKQQHHRHHSNRHDIAGLVTRLMQYTGSDDAHLARQFLEGHRFDVDEATEALLEYMESDEAVGSSAGGDKEGDDKEEEEEEVVEQDRVPRLWSDDGSGCRVLGHEAAAQALSESGGINHNHKHYSNNRSHNESNSGMMTATATELQLHVRINNPNTSNAKRKELKKQLRKHQNAAERKRYNNHSGTSSNSDDGGCDEAANVIVVKDIACLSI